MKNIHELAKYALELCDCLGIQYSDKISFGVKNYTAVWGKTFLRYNRMTGVKYYEIYLAKNLLADDVDDVAIFDTLIHEILHTVDGAMNHGEKWKALAEKVNKAYNLNIKRETSEEEKGIQIRPERKPKHSYKCNCCGEVFDYFRECKFTKGDWKYSYCGKCGATKGKLVQVF